MDFFASCELLFAVPAKRFTRDRAQPDAIRHTLMPWKIRFACGAPTTTPTHHPLETSTILTSPLRTRHGTPAVSLAPQPSFPAMRDSL
jgi:hypothetical protein